MLQEDLAFATLGRTDDLASADGHLVPARALEADRAARLGEGLPFGQIRIETQTAQATQQSPVDDRVGGVQVAAENLRRRRADQA